ncbi:MAG TPA: tyrosine--tRNA ligase [Bdellovibrionales bacterium]|nr:tyrosine--tRNA ligase [Bdellovibrionales bacterium]
MFPAPEEQLKQLKKGAFEIVSDNELLAKLRKSQKENKPLRVKAGFDPTRPDLHLGHTVLLNKMRQFQKLGHHVIFLIGDFTAIIGDPTGKNEARPPLTPQEVKTNAETYARQVYKVLDKDKTEVAYNSAWMMKFTPIDFIKLAGQYTVARMLERDDFTKRYQSQTPIHMHELLYPLVQGYDSVALKSDIELGGTDQKFNLLVGRELQKGAGQEPQCIMTVPILEGLDGVQKMSKSLDNYIAVEDDPRNMFGKTMRVSDELMFRYYELLTDITIEDLARLRQDVESGLRHPRAVKVELGRVLVERFHGAEAAAKAVAEFDRIFVAKGLPDDIPEKEIAAAADVPIAKLMVETGLAASNGEARRLIEGRAVEKDGEKIADPQTKLNLKGGESFVLKAGKKKFVRVKVGS